MHMIFSPLIISSGFHFKMMALFRMKCKSNALALCAIVTILLAQGGGLHRYVSMSPAGWSLEKVLPLTASHALFAVFRIYALRTELLNADQIR